MNTYKKIEINTIQDFLKEIIDLNHSNNKYIYRGVGDYQNFHLLPTLYRNKSLVNKNSKYITSTENTVYNTFIHKSIPYVDYQFKDKEYFWECLFFMQHYGIPTRLLDWTENPLVALYFALSSAIEKKTDAGVWYLNSTIWNKNIHKRINNDTYDLNDIKDLFGKEMSSQIENLNYPIITKGIYNNSRIIAQKGLFMIFGNDLTPLEESITNNDFPDNDMKLIIIEKNNLEILFNGLEYLGISESTIFPDLDGLSREIQRKFTLGEYIG